MATLDRLEARALQNEHPLKGVGVETQEHRGKARDYTQRSRQHFSEDARQLLFNYAPKGCERNTNNFSHASSDAYV